MVLSLASLKKSLESPSISWTRPTGTFRSNSAAPPLSVEKVGRSA